MGNEDKFKTYPKLITFDELAEFIGVSPATIQIWIRQGVIPSRYVIKLVNTFRLREDVIDYILNECTLEKTEKHEKTKNSENNENT